jgi:hypothetical protein
MRVNHMHILQTIINSRPQLCPVIRPITPGLLQANFFSVRFKLGNSQRGCAHIQNFRTFQTLSYFKTGGIALQELKH